MKGFWNDSRFTTTTSIIITFSYDATQQSPPSYLYKLFDFDMIASYTYCALGSCNSTLNISFFSQAAKVTSWQTKRNVDTIKKVVKEKIRLGNVVGGPYSRVKKAHFDKLSLSQKDEIRKVVIIQRFHNCLRNKFHCICSFFLLCYFMLAGT